MTEMFDLTKNGCIACGTGHISTPCQGGKRCQCRCRKCNAKMNHSPECEAVVGRDSDR